MAFQGHLKLHEKENVPFKIDHTLEVCKSLLLMVLM